MGVDVKNILLVLLALFILTSVTYAVPIQVDQTIDIFQDKEFFVEITNPYAEAKVLNVNIYTPTPKVVLAPDIINAGETVKVKIYLQNTLTEYTEISSKLEVYLDEELTEKELTLRFFEKGQAPDVWGDFASGLFGLGIFFDGMNFVVSEYYLAFLLIMIIAALLIALVVRVAKRVY